MRLVRSELLKISTTSAWWIFLLISLPLWALALGFNWLQTWALTQDVATSDVSPEDQAALDAVSDATNLAANLFTNGQFFGVMMVMLLGIVVVTSEYFHQTVTTTFLTTPHRTAVVLAKLAAAAGFGVLFWLITTALNLAATPLILASVDVAVPFGETAIWSAIGLNGLAYLLWAILGVGVGVLIRSQLGATITAILLYLAGSIGAAIVLAALAARFGDWINDLQLLVPSLASQLMVTGTDLPGAPPRWAGAAVLIGYAIVTGVIGTLIMRRRDVS